MIGRKKERVLNKHKGGGGEDLSKKERVLGRQAVRLRERGGGVPVGKILMWG